MINSGMISLMIHRTEKDPNIWQKQRNSYFLPEHSEYQVTLSLNGPIPELILEKRPYIRKLRGSYREVPALPVDRVTDLDGRPGFFKANAVGTIPQYWIATLLDKISRGDIPQKQTIQATIEEAQKRLPSKGDA